jgi:UMF1 family MFS transporter
MQSTEPLAVELNVATGVSRREVWGWAMYDFANSSFVTVVIAAVFNAYFVAVVADGKPWATFAWTASLATANIILMLIGPVLGAFVDLRANKKRLLLFSTVCCVCATAGLALTRSGTLVLATTLVVFATVSYGIGEMLIAAFLPELANKENQGKLSGWGWSIGNAGGLSALVLCLFYINWASSRGDTAEQYVPVTMLITAGMFAMASVPTFLWLRERAQAQAQPAGISIVHQSIEHLFQTLRRMGHYQDLSRYLICMSIYHAGIQTAVAAAAIYAQQVMGFSTHRTLLLLIVVIVAVGVGALVFGYIHDRIGPVATIAIALVGWNVETALLWIARDEWVYWLAVNVGGLSLGGSAAAARAFVGVLTPPARSGEFFGLWMLASRLAAVSFFVVGLLLLFTVNAGRGKRAAMN